MLKTGDAFEFKFAFSQDEVNAFAKISGDDNPVHLDEEYAATTVYKKPIIHGFLGSSVISRIFGTMWPGEGTVYLHQQLSFKRPMYVDQEYKAVLTVKEVVEGKHRATIITNIIETANGKPVVTGEAQIMNKAKLL